MTHVLALKDSNRAIAIIEDGIASWFMGNLLMFDVIPVLFVGQLTHCSAAGDIKYLLIHVASEERPYYHLIIEHPSDLSLEEAYKIL